MFDVLVRNGRVVSSDGVRTAHLGISGGVVQAVIDVDASASGALEIDAAGKYVMPGLVDAHVHLREPGLEHKEDFGSGTKAAMLGGVTTVMDMPTDDPWTASVEDFEQKCRLIVGKAFVDVALQAALGPTGGPVDELAALGAVSFEIFLTGGRPEFLVANDVDLLATFREVKRVGKVAGVTAGSPSIVEKLVASAKARGEKTVRAFADARPPIAEALGVARSCATAASTGCPIHFRQISCVASVDILRRFADLAPLSAEVTPHNLLLTDEDADRLGPFGLVIPPLRSIDEIKGLRHALRQRQIDIVATDHAPHLSREKERGLDDIWLAPPGLPGLQTFLPVMLELVALGVLTLSEVARTCAEMPARLFGLYPQKGTLKPGADADLVVVDPGQTNRIRNEDQISKAGFTPFAGHVIEGRIDTVLLRGSVVVRDGRPVPEPRGRFVRPKG